MQFVFLKSYSLASLQKLTPFESHKLLLHFAAHQKLIFKQRKARSVRNNFAPLIKYSFFKSAFHINSGSGRVVKMSRGRIPIRKEVMWNDGRYGNILSL